MVKRTLDDKKPTRAERIIYSALRLSLIGGAIAVLGAPLKWGVPHWF
jgi:hypothetical protein